MNQNQGYRRAILCEAKHHKIKIFNIINTLGHSTLPEVCPIVLIF